MHWLIGIDGVYEGGQPPSPLRIGVADAVTVLAAAETAIKATMGLQSIIAKT